MFIFPQERKFVGGANQISECMARELGDRVKLQSAVYSIDQSGDLVEVKTINEETYKVNNIIHSRPHLKSLQHADFIGDISWTFHLFLFHILITAL